LSGRELRPDTAAFNELLVQSVDETIAGILGKTVSSAFTNYMHNNFGLEIREIPSRPETLFTALHDSFGLGGDRLGKYIVRKLYQKAGVEFPENDGHSLTEYIQALKTRITDEELQ
jgi:serine/threonine protein phosphatase PrpC